MVDLLSIKITADASGAVAAEKALNGVTSAAKRTDAAIDGVSRNSMSASQRMAAAAAQHAKQQDLVMRAVNDNIRLTRTQMQGLGYQINDIGTMLAMGASPFQILASQGGQVIQLLGDGPGGMTGSLKAVGLQALSLAARFAPIGLAVGGAALAIGGMADEINKTADVTVSFGDTALAVWQSIAAGVGQFIAPVTNQIGEWFAAAWALVTDATKEAGNWMVRIVVGAVEIIRTTAASIGPAFVLAGQAAANGFIAAIQWMVDQSVGGINALIDGMNGLGEAMGGAFEIARIEAPKLASIDIGGAGALDDYNAKWESLGDTMAHIGQQDYMGAWFGDIQQRAIENANQRLAETETAASDAGSAAEKAAEQNDKLNKALEEQAKAAKDAAQSVGQAVGGAFQSLFDGPLTSVQDALDGILGSFAQLGQQNLSNLFQPGQTQASMFGAANDNWVGSSGYAKVLEEAVATGTETGWLQGLGGMTASQNKMYSAGLGGLGIGYQTQSPITGAVAGAMVGISADEERKAA